MQRLLIYLLSEEENILYNIGLLCAKIQDRKILILSQDDISTKELDDSLWTFSQSHFIPHVIFNLNEKFLSKYNIFLATISSLNCRDIVNTVGENPILILNTGLDNYNIADKINFLDNISDVIIIDKNQNSHNINTIKKDREISTFLKKDGKWNKIMQQ
jgi:hypothetical protein